VIDEIAAAVSGKTPTALTEEDYGRAVGVVEMASVFRQLARQFAVVLPSGERRVLTASVDPAALVQAESDIEKWRHGNAMTQDHLACLALCAIYKIPAQRFEVPEKTKDLIAHDSTAPLEESPIDALSRPSSDSDANVLRP
jgi:hypothetical protein